MKKLLVALVFGGIAFSAVFAAAATLGLTTDDLGAGDEAVLSCADTVNVTYTTALVGPQYNVATVTLNGLTAACVGQTYKINLLGTSDASLSEKTAVIVGGDIPNLTVDFSSPAVGAEVVLHVAAVITGPAAP